MSLSPTFSIVVPTYNRLPFLKQALRSVWSQTNADFELIVVDDGSTDGTEEWLAAQSQKLRYRRQQNQGPSSARNAGIEMATGDYVAFLDSDDLWFPWTLSTIARAIEQFGSPALIVGSALEFEDRPPDLQPAELAATHFADYLASSRMNYFLGVNVCIAKRSVVLSSGGFDPELWAAEDFDLALKMGIKKGFVLIRGPYTLAYRRHDASLTGQMRSVVAGSRRLIANEHAGRYPGGPTRSKDRQSVITQVVRPVTLAAIGNADLRGALDLYLKTFWWHVTQARLKYLLGFWIVLFSRTRKTSPS